MTIKIPLASGADERVNPNRLFYIRDPLASELDDEPEAQSVLSFPGATFLCATARDTLASIFSEETPLARLSLPNGAPVFVRATAVVDVDDPVSTNPVGTATWLVFGAGPRARRLATRESRAVLSLMWIDLGLVPADHGI
ncbi:MAG: hypothetical protein ABJI96_16370 [Paracoccaceae bacterium]